MTATNQKIRRLPGFRFEAQAASREDVLPRMDIALFVGFAASGPIGIPVVLESAEQFETIFGKDLSLCWDREKGETIYAYLAPTVRAFFRNGGNRCWIIRTARLLPTTNKPLNRACYNFFPLAGFASVDFDKPPTEIIMPALARARAKGSWSGDLQISTAVLSSAVGFESLDDSDGQKIVKLEVSANQKIVKLEVSANQSLEIGELLRCTFSEKGLVLLLTVDKIETSQANNSPPILPTVGKRIIKISSKHFVWLENLKANSTPNTTTNVSVKMWTQQNRLDSEDIPQSFLIERQAELSVEKPEGQNPDKLPPKIKLKFADLSSADLPSVGSLLVTELNAKTLCLQVETVSINDFEPQKKIEVSCRAVFCQKEVTQPILVKQVERLTFELWLKKDEKSFIKLSDLAFNSSHKRFWGNLPTDENLYRFSDDRNGEFPEIPAWTQAGDAANFPIAGNGDGFYFPLFPTAFPENYLSALPLQGTKHQHDGLEEFDAEFFLDDKLKPTGLNNLLNEAEFIRYLSPRPRPLWGIHSALAPETAINLAATSLPPKPGYANLSLEEATIISVPDALHRGWHPEQDDGKILSPPPISLPPLRPEWWHFQDCRQPDIEPTSEPRWGNFLDCEIRVVGIPKNLRPKDDEIRGGNFTLGWKNTEKDKSVEFVLEESATPKFEFAQKIYRGKKKEFTVSERGAGIFYYRVRAEIGRNFSDWSNGLAIKVPTAENWVANPVDEYNSDVLFAVQRALLRTCAARGDLFAVLTLPEHYNQDKAVNHAAMLKTTKGLTPTSAGVEPFSADETKALSFGAMYHPWLLTREEDFESLRNIPSDGAICGVMARRTIRRGAWIAPANESLQGVLGLVKTFQRESFLDFQDASINLVRNEPNGFLVLNSDTLSDDSDLRSINVRRLLSLLRRLALKHGAEYVFEPNDERFRRQVERGFSSLLDLMFVRGAFAGTTPTTSYQVVVNESVNNFQSVEQGRFIVELRVAPSLPLKFVTVRLVQAGGRSNVSEVF